MECLNDFVDSDSEVRVIDKIIDTLDVEKLGFSLGDNEEVGRPKFDSRDMLKLFVYGYFNGIRSSRKLAKQAIINREIIWLINGKQPRYRVIADFRKDNIDALTKVFESFVSLCIELGLYGKELIAVDGTKLEASASKRKHYSKNKLSKMKEVATNKINEYMHELEKNDLLEDKDEVEFEKVKIENAIKKLESKINEYNELEKTLEDQDMSEINLSDSDAKTVKFGAHQGTDVGYNVQAAVDAKNKLVAAFEVTNNSTDHGQLYNMSDRARKVFNVDSIESLADKGYFDPADLKKCEENHIISYVSRPVYGNIIGDSIYFNDKFEYNPQEDIYICPQGQKLLCISKRKDLSERKYANSEACLVCLNKDKCTTAKNGRIVVRKENQDFVDIVDKRTKENQVKYKQRQEIIEHVFGTVKRSMNFTYLLLGGFRKVSGEVSMALFSYNLKRAINILGVEKLLGYLVN